MGHWRVIAGPDEGPARTDLSDLFRDLADVCGGNDLTQQEVSVAWFEDENDAEGIIVLEVDRLGRPDRFSKPTGVA